MKIIGHRKPTQVEAPELRNLAKLFGYKIRVKVCNMSLRVVGDRVEVKSLLSILEYSTAGGELFRDRDDFLAWNGVDQVFAYVPAWA